MNYRVITLRIMTMTIVATLATSADVVRAAPTEGSLELSVSRGYDTNPLELNGHEVIAPFEASGGSYTRFGLDARLAHTWNPRFGYFASAQGQGRLFATGLQEADASSGKVEAGLGLVLFARGEKKLSASLSGSFGLDRSTFVDPATGKMYVTLSDPNTLAPIPDRFDADITTVSLDLRLRTSQTLIFSLDTSVERQNYVNDYKDVPTLEPLDDRSLTLRPGVRWQMSEKVRLDVTAEWNNRRYDALSSLDAAAAPVAGERRRYRTEGLRTVLRVAPSKSWSFQLGLGGADRQDLYAGYYDSIGLNGFASAAWAVTPTTRLGLHLSRAVIDYQRATLGFVPNGELRGGSFFRSAASVERDLGAKVALFGEAGLVNSDNVDPLYAYHRGWAAAGVRCKL